MRYLLIILCFFWSCSEEEKKDDNFSQKNVAKFMPDNNLSDSPNFKTGSVTESDFEEVINSAEYIYRPIFAYHGLELVVEKDWSDDTVNAYASRDVEIARISFFGGLARRPEVTKEGFALVVCHEIGHHLAGYPFYPQMWAANEGNSDFYSTASCARKIFSSYSGINFLPENSYDPYKRQICSGMDSESCARAYNGGLSLAKLLAVLNSERVPRYETPDRSVVRQTQHLHPKAQCRLDTMLAGMKCNREWDDSIIPRNIQMFQKNSCPTRPRCWFAG